MGYCSCLGRTVHMRSGRVGSSEIQITGILASQTVSHAWPPLVDERTRPSPLSMEASAVNNQSAKSTGQVVVILQRAK